MTDTKQPTRKTVCAECRKQYRHTDGCSVTKQPTALEGAKKLVAAHFLSGAFRDRPEAIDAAKDALAAIDAVFNDGLEMAARQIESGDVDLSSTSFVAATIRALKQPDQQAESSDQ